LVEGVGSAIVTLERLQAATARADSSSSSSRSKRRFALSGTLDGGARHEGGVAPEATAAVADHALAGADPVVEGAAALQGSAPAADEDHVHMTVIEGRKAER